MTPLSPKARALLARTSKSYQPSDIDRERLRRSLATRVGVGIAAGAATVASGTLAANAAAAPSVAAPAATLAGTGVGIAAKSSIGMGAKILASVLLVTSAAATSVVIVQQTKPSAAPQLATVQASPVVIATHAPALPVTASPSPLPSVDPPRATQVSAVATSAPRPTPTALAASPRADAVQRAVSEDSLGEEVVLLRAAQTALGRHEAARALDALDTHARKFPNGMLAEERSAARVFALCELGRPAEGATAKAHFLTHYPSSPTAERVRQACNATPRGE